ncbi:hypothetical protein [Anaeromyxobacter paludicola]|uniref:Fimbrial assembly protein n=1 Tax=Anaeromyxobacter paludicola TaxID=2918171 RepID=A0ABM7XFC6_9BACT|nr:hypothetical protein [Anaeromyxobacter paludicola]BDG10532.1 hypothetical protein AMPC_36450 [Anaeromyxobacter paludicola]
MAQESLQFGRVTERAGTDRKVWLFVLPAMAALVLLLVFAGLAISRTSGLETQVRQLTSANQELQKNLDERDQVITKQRADVSVLETPGSGATLLTSPDPKGIASGVALYHPEHHALNAYLFGMTAPPAGQEYRLEAVVGKEGERKPLGKVDPDASGSAFFLSKEVPDGLTGVHVALYPAGQQGAPAEGKPLLTGVLPGVGQTGVADQRVQARTPPAETRRGR